MIFDLVQDFLSVLDAMPAGHSRQQSLSLLGEAIRRDVHFINRHPTTLFQCLWNTCWWYDCPAAVKFYDTAPDGAGISPAPSSQGRLSDLLERWRRLKSLTTPGVPWIRAARPPAMPLGGPQKLLIPEHAASLAWSPDGRHVVTGGGSGSVALWDVKTGALVWRCDAHRSVVNSIEVSSDGRKIGSASGERYHGYDASIRITDLETGHQLTHIRYSRHAGSSGDVIASVAFSQDAGRIAGACCDGTVRIWDVQSGEEVACLAGHHDAVQRVAYVADGAWLCSSAVDRTLRIWDAENGTLALRLADRSFQNNDWVLANRDDSWSVPIAPDSLQGAGKAALRAAIDGYLRRRSGSDAGVYDSMILEIDRKVRHRPVVAYSSLLVAFPDNGITVEDVDSGTQLTRCQGHDGAITSLAFSRDASRLASSGNDGTVRVWSLQTPPQVAELVEHKSPITDLKLLADSHHLATGSLDGTIRIWDGDTGLEVRQLAIVTEPVESVDARTGARFRGTTVGTGPIHRVEMSFDGQRLTSLEGPSDGNYRLRIWDVESGRQLTLIEEAFRLGVQFVLSSDGRRIVTIDGPRRRERARVWDTDSGRMISCLTGRDWRTQACLDSQTTHQLVPEFDPRCVSFDPNALRIVSGSGAGFIGVHDVESGAEVHCISGDWERVESTLYLTDGQHIAAGVYSSQGTNSGNSIRIWQLDPPEQVAVLTGLEYEAVALAIAADGRRLIAREKNRLGRVLLGEVVHVWDLGTCERLETLHGIRDVDSTTRFRVTPEHRAFAAEGETVIDSAPMHTPVGWFSFHSATALDYSELLQYEPRSWAITAWAHLQILKLEGGASATCSESRRSADNP